MRNQSLLLAIGGIVFLMLVGALIGSGTEHGLSTPHTSRSSGSAPGGAPQLPAGTDVAAWARSAAPDVDIPERVLRAYANAEVLQHKKTPSCRLSWTTIAGIGSVESRHASSRGAELGDDGKVSPPIIGIALNGSTGGTRAVSDTDGGKLDGDARHDRAVGPMQFLPSTWKRYGADGNGDGVADPQQIDDAALAAAGYLCAHGRDVGGSGWWSGVKAYNASMSYARDVWDAADEYASLAAGAVSASGR
ncbi:lytic transglycosylase domain-containing protein [Pseudonocardia phyllosphaerae]|uniref:lytic transglycosylase domain-containing protein n=1 Tax=Pseudonocardia phyllosphaerae TaxID=3390502 RepID=UPI00397E8056